MFPSRTSSFFYPGKARVKFLFPSRTSSFFYPGKARKGNKQTNLWKLHQQHVAGTLLNKTKTYFKKLVYNKNTLSFENLIFLRNFVFMLGIIFPSSPIKVDKQHFSYLQIFKFYSVLRLFILHKHHIAEFTTKNSALLNIFMLLKK